MKKEPLKLHVWLYVVLCVLLFFRIVLQSADFVVFFRLEYQYLLSIALCLVGIILGNLVTTIVHEFGHLIALKLKKCIILEFSAACFKYTKTQKKPKISFSLKNSYNGYVSFVGSSVKKVDLSVYLSIVFAWIATVVCIFVFTMLFAFLDNFYCFCIFGGMVVASLFFMLINFLSFMPSTDGDILFNVKKNSDRILSLKETETRLYLGETLSSMNDSLFATETVFRNGYLSYLRQLELNNLQNAKDLLKKTFEKNQKTFDNQPIALDIENFFIAILEKDQQLIDSLKANVIAFCDGEITPTTLRIMIAYRMYNKEQDWLNALKNSFKSQSDFILSGLYKTESTIVNNLSNWIEK